jgi:hypothetical protein
MSTNDNTFIDKTTLIKTDRPFEVKACIYKDGFKIESKYKMDLDNSIDMDKLHETDPLKNQIRQAIQRLIEIYESLGYKHLTDQ